MASNATAQAPHTVFQETNGLVAVEAEHFFDQTHTDTRAFHLTTATITPSITPDGDPPHVGGTSGGAYLEILPDTRRTHGDKLIKGENFSPQPGKMAVLQYKVNFTTLGRYYVWVRAYSTGSEDNGLHVGINGTWPESGQRLQWCTGKHSWHWESKQRTNEEHSGEPRMTYPFVSAPVKVAQQTTKNSALVATSSPTRPVSSLPLIEPRQADGDGSIEISGETKQWHKVTLTMAGPFAHEQDNEPNPFTDYRMTVTFQHADGTEYTVPGYFAADGAAANSSGEFGTAWRAHFAADRTGQWQYRISFHQGLHAALDVDAAAQTLAKYDGKQGVLSIAASDKQGRDLRAHGRLQYVGKHYLQFAGTGKYFLKAGADAPETLLGYTDFDNTIAGKPKKVPLKTWQPHVQDWRDGDPTWKDGQGKGLVGAINYLSGKGCNAFSFLTYNAGGDGDNVWPFIHRDDKLHYDCSKLDQWGIVFDHGTHRGMYLHFKMQETENDDNFLGSKKLVPESLDGGDLGVQRKLYCRELIARYAHNLALNWNLGEENTQTTEQQKAMLDYIAKLDAYGHNRVLHTFPNEQDKKYRPLLGDQSKLTGASLQNSRLPDTHPDTVKWVRESAAAGKPWVVAFDESGSAAHAQCPDLGYKGFDGHDVDGKFAHTQHEVRKQTLWGTLMGGGAGVEYYFGYKFVENDLRCEDWRSRDQSWDYCRIAINFFADHEVPFWLMTCQDELVGNPDHDNSKYCLAQTDAVYLVYLPGGGTTGLDLTAAKGNFQVHWFNPRSGGDLRRGTVAAVTGGGPVQLGDPPSDAEQDWLVMLRR